jgi:hypothetical protein
MPDGIREFIDEPSLVASEVLYRAVDPTYVDDWSGLAPCIPSRTWQDQKEDVAAQWGLGPCASVAVARLLDEHGSSVDAWLEKFFKVSYGVVETTVGQVRSATSAVGALVPQGVMLHATSDQPWHAVVWSRKGAKRSKGEMKALVAVSNWLRHPRR